MRAAYMVLANGLASDTPFTPGPVRVVVQPVQFNLFGGGFIHKRSGRGRLGFRLDFWAGQLLGLLLLGVFLILLASSALFVLKPRYRAVVEVPVARWYCRG